MKYIKMFILRGLVGCTIGVFINQLITVLIACATGNVYDSPNMVIFQFVISVISGFYFVGITTIFSVEQWSLLKKTIIHAICMLMYFPIAMYAGWAPSGFNTTGKILFFIWYVCVYLIIWFSIKRYKTKKAIELNEELKKRKERIEKEK
ncbi:DUF3021 domain-containing protein [Eubacterium multiforme]|uniref:DUF3021 domain-containing protein n=1 Tax=Eubacterium multiforme TaxID=83339 RepID=A0ABT9UYA7_9FIRM|nr:DUF3021 domain-containing protein [Eubacterium multiforme]MDQ0151286.1 hypothetical protein [Eubacterium multiforme]